MNTNPLMPGGVEQKNQGRARVKIAVFFVLAVHVVVLGALLMQGCKREEAPPTGDTNTPQLLDTNPPVVADTNPPPLPPPVVSLPTNPPSPVIAPPVVSGSEEPMVYEVKSGDTLSAIAQKYHTTVRALRAANNLTTDRIKVGQKLKIPGTSAPAPSAIVPTTIEVAASSGGVTEYRIVKGDTFDRLSKKFHVSVKAIQDANPGVDPTKLQINQKINIPTAAPTVPPSVESSPVVPPSAPAPGAPPSR